MKAIVQKRYGPPEFLEFKDVEKPAIGDDEVLVRVHASSVNAGDWVVCRGTPALVRLDSGFFKPKALCGMDIAGVIEAVGPRVTRLKPGDAVFGQGNGAYAEFARVKENHLALKPTNLTFLQSAAIPLAGLTALHAIRDKGQVARGQRVLITGAGGGVGSFAVQIAKALGATVTGVCSTGKVDLVRSIGADTVIDYTREDFTRTDVRYDVIMDNGLNNTMATLRRLLTERGTLIPNNGQLDRPWFGSLGSVFGALMLSPFIKHNLRPFLSLPNGRDMEALKELAEAGKLTPAIDRVFQLAETPLALAKFGRGHARGKLVIRIAETD